MNTTQPYYIYPGKPRVDGKIPTQLAFPISGKRFTKLYTPEQLAAKQAELHEKMIREEYIAK